MIGMFDPRRNRGLSTGTADLKWWRRKRTTLLPMLSPLRGLPNVNSVDQMIIFPREASSFQKAGPP
jgi:hypothetical protein